MTHRQTTEQSHNTSTNVLIVDDEADLRELLEITLARMGCPSVSVANLAAAKEMLAQQPFSLCLTDMRLPDGRGMELVEWIQRQCPEVPVAVITAYGNMELAVEALRAGAFDCVSKPVDLAAIRALVSQAVSLPAQPQPSGHQGVIGESAVMLALKARVDKLARSQAPVCISGESGSGKEVIARQIHARSARADKPFIAVNCGAIPAELIESEFFGHLKGSFTGASQHRSGFFQSADGGTLFLDEVADMPLAMQVKLLRAIQERQVRPVGSEQEQPVDVRIVSASHKPLQQEVLAGRFREDLYYRINVIELHVPPLRERAEDIPLLVTELISRIGQQYGVQFSISGAALAALTTYPFPGNVRELENILERAAALCERHCIDVQDLALNNRVLNTPFSPATSSSVTFPLADDDPGECSQVLDALERHRWNRTAAARALGLTLRQLRYRIKKYRLE